MAVICSLLIAPGDPSWAAASAQGAQAQQAEAKVPPQELDSLVAPIALYPDSLLSQALVASTYPLEIVQLQQWLEQNKNLKDKALTDAAMKQPWDPSVQAMAVLPDLVKQLASNIKWTTDLGNAFLAQQSDVMDAVQRMRSKAQEKGNLKSSEQQKVETKVIESKQVIVIQPTNPEVVYVPSYNPTVVYGPPPYPYPPVYYPPPGYYAAGMAISFGVGMMVGAAWGGGGWGCGWGGNNNVYINNNNNFVKNSNIQGGNRVNAQGGNTNWQHNSQHRGSAPYSNKATANKYGGTTRGGTSGNPGGARQPAGGGSRASAGTMDRGGSRGAAPSAGTMDRSASRGSAGSGGGDQVGNRSVPSSSAKSSSAFGGGSSSAARASSSRGSSSYGGGGGRSGGGGGRRR
ncbi:MAG: DUF3300 domain-containing protein [Terracidiphilus sp.]